MTLSFQLYSARNFQPWDGVLALLSRSGYAAVEGYGDAYADASGFRALLDRHGLSMPTGHFSVDFLETDPDGAVAAARTLGMKAVYCPWLDPDERPTDMRGWISFARRLTAIARTLKGEGLRFGWHNHDFEFAKLPDGDVPMRILLAEAPEIEWEADVAWIVRGGAGALDWIARHGDRIGAVHVKDIAPRGQALDEDGWADVGSGTVDWPTILDAIGKASPSPLFILEHDNPSDLARFAGRSIEWMKGRHF